MIFIVYGIMFLALGIGVMIALQAQVEHESADPEVGDIPESITIKRHRATGWRQW